MNWHRNNGQRFGGVVSVGMLSVLIGSSVLAAQAKPETVPAYRNRLLGVYDFQSGEPIQGVRVLDVLNKNSSLTSKTGTVSLFFLPDGGGIISITKIGYAPQDMPVAISPADTEPIMIMLTRVTELGPVVATADAPKYASPMLREFEERRAAGFGRFISEAELRRDESRVLRNVLVGLPGVEIIAGPRGSEFVSTQRSAASFGGNVPAMNAAGPPAKCRSAVYLDGAKLGDQDLRQLPQINQLAGIEWYAGAASLPPKYAMTGNSCGVLLLWTRER